MKPIYWLSIRTADNRRVFVARAHTEPQLRGYEVCSLRVSTDHRGHGYGSAILRKLIDAADAEGVPLYIVARPFDSSPLSRQDTAKWYDRHGFTDRRHGFMVRSPLLEAKRADTKDVVSV